MKRKIHLTMLFAITLLLFCVPAKLLGAETSVNSLSDLIEGDVEAAGALNLRPLLGDWYNVDSSTGGLVRIVITEVAGQIMVHPYGACTPTPCDWGEVPGIAYARGVAEDRALAFSAFFDSGWKETIVTGIRRPRGILIVTSFSIFKDSSGRSNYFSTDRFILDRQ